MPPIEPPMHAEQRLDAEMVEQHRLRAHHVADGDHRQVEAVGRAGRRIGRGRAGRAHAAADDVGADDEVAVGVDRLAGADHRLHQPGLPVTGWTLATCWSPVSAWQTRMALERGLALSVAVGLVGDLARFVFGFSVKVTAVRDPAAVVAAVAGANDLGIIARAAPGAWWRETGRRGYAAHHGVPALHQGGRQAGRSAGLRHFAAAGRSDDARYRRLRGDRGAIRSRPCSASRFWRRRATTSCWRRRARSARRSFPATSRTTASP
jgi:hypothetical protein